MFVIRLLSVGSQPPLKLVEKQTFRVNIWMCRTVGCVMNANANGCKELVTKGKVSRLQYDLAFNNSNFMTLNTQNICRSYYMYCSNVGHRHMSIFFFDYFYNSLNSLNFLERVTEDQFLAYASMIGQ